MQITITRLAELSGMGRDTVRKRCAKLIGEGRGATVESSEALALLYGNERLDPQQERAMLDKVRRETAELEFQQKRGQLIQIETVFRVIDAATSAAREGLQNIPGRLSAVLAAESDAWEIERTLDAEIRTALQNIAGMRKNFKG